MMVRNPNNSPGLRITVVIDKDVDKKLRLIQAKLILKTTGGVSYSRVLNDTLRKAL